MVRRSRLRVTWAPGLQSDLSRALVPFLQEGTNDQKAWLKDASNAVKRHGFFLRKAIVRRGRRRAGLYAGGPGMRAGHVRRLRKYSMSVVCVDTGFEEALPRCRALQICGMHGCCISACLASVWAPTFQPRQLPGARCNLPLWHALHPVPRRTMTT